MSFARYTALAVYLNKGVDPGALVRCLLEGDLEGAKKNIVYPDEAISHCDPTEYLTGFMTVINISLPTNSHGSKEKVSEWINHQGLSGASDEVKVMAKLTDNYDVKDSFLFDIINLW